MKSQDKTEKETQSAGNGLESQCCCPEGMREMVASCCEDMGEGAPADMTGMMEKCCEHMKRACRWFPLIPIVLAGAAFLLGHYLSPDAVRVLWLVVSGAVVVAGSLGLILVHAMYRT